jgi:DNA polymerase III delta subunit
MPSSTKKISAEQFVKTAKAVLKTHADDESKLLALTNASLTSPFIIIGADRIRVKRVVKWIRNIFPEGDKAYFGSDLSSLSSIKPLIQSFQNLSLFSKIDTTVIYDAHSIKAAIAKPLSESIKTCRKSKFIILTAPKVDKTTPLLNYLSSCSTTISVNELKGGDLKRWIAKESLDAGAPITPDAAELLVKRFGSDVSSISQELTKLALLTKPEEKITRTLVEYITLKTPEHTSFELVNEIAKKNVLGVQLLTKELLEKGLHPLQLSYFLSRAFRTLLYTNDDVTHKSAVTASELSNQWFNRNLNVAKKSFNLADIRKCIELIKQLDFQLKDSKIDDITLISTITQRLCTRNF